MKISACTFVKFYYIDSVPLFPESTVPVFHNNLLTLWIREVGESDLSDSLQEICLGQVFPVQSPWFKRLHIEQFLQVSVNLLS